MRPDVVGAPGLRGRGEQHDDTGGLTPLGLAGADELVDDRLGAVDEVAELTLPQHQRIGSPTE